MLYLTKAGELGRAVIHPRRTASAKAQSRGVPPGGLWFQGSLRPTLFWKGGMDRLPPGHLSTPKSFGLGGTWGACSSQLGPLALPLGRGVMAASWVPTTMWSAVAGGDMGHSHLQVEVVCFRELVGNKPAGSSTRACGG